MAIFNELLARSSSTGVKPRTVVRYSYRYCKPSHGITVLRIISKIHVAYFFFNDKELKYVLQETRHLPFVFPLCGKFVSLQIQ